MRLLWEASSLEVWGGAEELATAAARSSNQHGGMFCLLLTKATAVLGLDTRPHVEILLLFKFQ